MVRSAAPAILLLADGTRFDGRLIGAAGEIAGEVVFNTALAGYQEILTDPSYAGQLVTMTSPLIGNYGTTDEDGQSARIQATALIIREMAGMVSNHRSQRSLQECLELSGVTGIEGIDTRELVLKLRSAGAMNGIVSSVDFDEDSLRAKLDATPSMAGLNLVKYVTCAKRYVFKPVEHYHRRKGKAFHCVAYDYGIKRNILEMLHAEGFDVTVVPAATTAEQVLKLDPDAIFCSNGPGDPEALPHEIAQLQKLIGKRPIFGICLGHQLLGLALGAKTFKLKFGHRGGNHPVRDESTGKIEITSQNHGFCVDPATLPSRAEFTHWNLNDKTLEGFRCKDAPVFAVQYHPEASPGPHDSSYLFPRFRKMVQDFRGA